MWLPFATENRVLWTCPEGRSMNPPYGPEIIHNCETCAERGHSLFCNLSDEAITQLNEIQSVASYPQGTVLFREGQDAQGIFILCYGRAKLSTSPADGKTIILRIAEAGEVLGLNSAMASRPYDLTAKSMDPTQANFISTGDFTHFLSQHGEAAVRVAQQLSENYHSACQEIRQLGISGSASEKMARLLLEWSAQHGGHGSKDADVRLTMDLTHEEIAQLIGASRETVTRTFGDFKRKKLIEVEGVTVILRNKNALEKMVTHK
jgi:CRP/FNR family cyclic AMP-dependent transcriptional regulator